MADKTHIEWTDATWNPITGCSVVSPGCTNCYAMRLAGTRLRHHKSRAGLTIATKAGPVWNGKTKLNEEWLDQPLRWRRPRRIFVCAHGDLFHESVPDEWIDRVFAVMALAPQHTFQVLTKRPERMRGYVAEQLRGARCILDHIFTMLPMEDPRRANGSRRINGTSLSNVWLGTSTEDQQRADERIPHLLATSAAVRFVSAEPLLGPIDFNALADGCENLNALSGLRENPFGAIVTRRYGTKLDWVIVGGESGRGFCDMREEWADSLKEQCAAAGTAFFVKQMANKAPIPERLMVRQMPGIAA